MNQISQILRKQRANPLKPLKTPKTGALSGTNSPKPILNWFSRQKLQALLVGAWQFMPGKLHTEALNWQSPQTPVKNDN